MEWDFLFYLFVLLMIVLNGMVRFKYLTIPFKVLTILIFIILLSELSTRILRVTIRNTNPAYHILCILQYWGIAFIFSKLFKRAALKKAVLVSIIPFTIVTILNTLFFQTFFKFPSSIIMLSYLIFICFSLILCIQMLHETEEVNIFKQSTFWFNIGILVYSITIPVCFGVLNYLIKHKLQTNALNLFIEYFTILYYLVLGYSIHLDKRERSLIS